MPFKLMQNPVGADAPARLKRLPVVLIVLGLVAIFGLSLLYGLQWLKHRLQETGFTSDITPRRYVIGNDMVAIPLNTMRFANQRDTETPDQLDVVLLLPEVVGYHEQYRAAFEDTGESRRTIFITLTRRQMQYDMTGRLGPIYSGLFDGPATSGPAGLRFQTLKPGTGYDGERLAIFDQNGTTWVARCQNENSTATPTCLRDIFVGKSLSLRYRFPLPMLKNWRGIEQVVHKKAADWLVN